MFEGGILENGAILLAFISAHLPTEGRYQEPDFGAFPLFQSQFLAILG